MILADQDKSTIRILGPNGEPMTRESAPDESFMKSMSGQIDSYLRGLAQIRMPASIRARDPLSNHPWVFACAMAAAMTVSQVPYTVFRETEETTSRRRMMAKRAGRQFFNRSGRSRRAVLRHIMQPTSKRVFQKSAEPDFDHPIMDLLLHPNPYQVGTQIFAFTTIWLMIRGEVFWVFTDDNDRPTSNNPTRIYPIGPDSFKPALSHGDSGSLVGWELVIPQYIEGGGSGARVMLSLDQVLQFKFPDPQNPLRGMSRLTAAANDVESDMLMQSFSRNNLSNYGVPRAALQGSQKLSKTEVDAFKEMWDHQYSGPQNHGKVAVIPFGFQMQALGMTPQQMEFIGQEKLGMERLLAVMGTPSSVVGKTEAANWATALVWDRGYWDRTIIPITKLIETGIDSSQMFFTETDNVFGMFDLGQVDALRAGQMEKIEAADKLCQERLHCTPRVAYEVVGLEVADYPGDETALVSATATPLEAVLDFTGGEDPVAPLAPVEPVEEDPVQAPEPEPEPEPEPDATKGIYHGLTKRQRIQKAKSRWREFVAVQERMESRFRKAYRTWVAEMRALTMRRFDQATKTKEQVIDLTVVLPTDQEAANALMGEVRPLFPKMLDETYAFTLPELGVPVFELDDERLQRVLTDRERLFVQQTPVTLRKSLTRTLSEGIRNDETIQQLRVRIGNTYDISASSHKTLTVARTETAAFFNGERDAMLQAQGFKKHEWLTAGDEVVRDSHVKYGQAGPKEIGFNFRSIVGGGGVIRHPGESGAPPEEVINCRCMAVPVE